MTNHDLTHAPASSLAGILNLATDAKPAWAAHDLPAMLKHQLGAELRIELLTKDPQRQRELEALGDTPETDGPIHTFAELFHHPQPPLELLDACKSFAKQAMQDPEQNLPEELAFVLYYLSIAAAKVKLGRSITRLTDAELRVGLENVAGWRWLDDKSRALLTDAIGRL